MISETRIFHFLKQNEENVEDSNRVTAVNGMSLLGMRLIIWHLYMCYFIFPVLAFLWIVHVII